MKCQNRIDGNPCPHVAKFILRPNPNCHNICCNMYLCEYCAAYARIFTDDILDIEEGITFEQAAMEKPTAKTEPQLLGTPVQLSMFS